MKATQRTALTNPVTSTSLQHQISKQKTKKLINGGKKALLIVLGWILIISLAFEPFASYSQIIGTSGIISLVVGTLK